MLFRRQTPDLLDFLDFLCYNRGTKLERMLLKRKVVFYLSDNNQNKLISVCVIETQTNAQECFRLLTKAAMEEWQLKHNSGQSEQGGVIFSVFDNVNLSDILVEQEKSGTTLSDEFRKAIAGEEHDDGYQYVINMVGELVAEVMGDEDQSTWFILFPDTMYGSALSCHEGFFDARLLPPAETINNYFRDKYGDQARTIKEFGIIGDYDICSSLAAPTTEASADCSKYGLCLPYAEFDKIIELLGSEKPNQQQIEDLVVEQVRLLASNPYMKSASGEVLIGNLQLEMLLLGFKSEPSSLDFRSSWDYGVFLKSIQNPDQSFWESYRDAWQGRMQYLYNRDDWPRGVKLDSVLTYYAEIACGIIGCASELEESDFGTDGLNGLDMDGTSDSSDCNTGI